jgi:hypothetical protein
MALDEAESLELLRDFGLAANEVTVVETGQELLAAAADLNYPLVLKTAMPGIMHKSEHHGVCLDVRDARQLTHAYEEMASRLGPRALLAPMAGEGVELMFGARRDPQFGPIILMGFGGVLAEVVGDVVFALPPFGRAYARRRLNELKLAPVLQGIRGRPSANVDAFCTMAARFSALVYALGDDLQEVDVNPVIAGSDSCIAVDALIVART